MLRKILTLAIIFVLAFSVVAYAESASGKEHNPLTKLARGFLNLVGCLLEVPKQIYLVSEQEDPLTGMSYGMVKGFGMGAYRLLDGILETITFIFPPYDKILIEPEFVFEGWETAK